jgi:DNA-binding NarL/FixJ family response regulator
MPDAAASIETGRRAYADADWTTTFAELSRAHASAPLAADDLSLLARSAWLLSRVEDCLQLSEDAFRRYLDAGRTTDAAMAALVLSLQWITRGEWAVGSGWLNRGRRLLSDLPDSPAHAYLAYLDGMLVVADGGPAPTEAIQRLEGLAKRFGEPALESLWLAVSGVSELRHGERSRGFAQLDEAMLPVLAGDVPVEWAGDIYCTVIHVCHELADFRRMADWTSATERWCAQFASEAIYTGICRVHRLELKGIHGDWADVEAGLASESEALRGGNVWVAGEGFYQLGEIRRLRGDHHGARAAFDAARASGIDPQPGEALLALREGRADQAWTSLTSSLEGRDRVGRVRLLRAGVEIALANDRKSDAAALCRELRETATAYGSRGFAAWADHAEGMLAVEQGDGERASAALQSAAAAFRRDRQPYETAQALLWLSRARRLTGESDLAERDLSEGRAILQRLGAGESRKAHSPAVGPLTAREAEVLECVAAGAGNREVATQLFISEKTVGRHLANVYLKLGVSSRTAAAAWWRDQPAPSQSRRSASFHADRGRELHGSPDAGEAARTVAS